MPPAIVEIVGAVLFAIAIIHTLSTKFFERLAHRHPHHAGLWHLMGEVEVVFGFWALVLALAMFALTGQENATRYFDNANFTEPLFVFAIMVIAGTRPVMQAVMVLLHQIARLFPRMGQAGLYFLILCLLPLTGSLITEPAAMTIAAVILARQFFSKGVSEPLKYATLGVLLVNISIGGTLTAFAAPPVLMVAHVWHWDNAFMLQAFGWKAALAVAFNAAAVTLLFLRELTALPSQQGESGTDVPLPFVLLHILFLIGLVMFSHHPALFMGIFLFFLGLAGAYRRFHERLILREGLLVAFFLAGLVVLGGLQQWWLKPLLMSMNSTLLFFGTMGLTSFTDNTTLTYLGALVEGLPEGFRYALVAGAVAGGGMTIIANAPNPAGIAILRRHFHEESVSALWLAVAALAPTLVAAAAFWLL